MKYIIVAKNNFAGDSKSDAPNPTQITEIATELIITRLKLLDWLQTGIVSKDDCIVTINERKCLYTKIFNKVLSYENFREIQDKILPADIVDMLEPNLFNEMCGLMPVEKRIIPYMPFYQLWERDKHLITNVEWSNVEKEYDVSKPFVVLVIRTRGAWPEKNMSVEFWDMFLEVLKSLNIKTFVFGKETEDFADGKNVEHIKNYQDWCTIAHHPNCKRVVSTMTGGVYPCLVFGNPDIKMVIIDNTKLMLIYAYDPVFYHPCCNFSKIDIKFVDRIPTKDEIYDAFRNGL